MQHLQYLGVYPYHFSYTDFKLSPTNFEKFCMLPVSSVGVKGLDIKHDNVIQFREIMKRMKIKHLPL